MRAVAGLFLAVLGALTFLGVGAVPATADGTSPPAPPGVTIPAPTSMPTGPTYVVTPGVGGSTLPKPVDPTVAQHAAAAATRGPTRPRHRQHGVTKPVHEADAPTVQRAVPADTSKQDLWWEIGAGALLVLVLTEVFRVGIRRASGPRTT